MSYRPLLLMLFLMIGEASFSQSPTKPVFAAASFCGKPGESGPPPAGQYTKADLRGCDFVIHPVDSSLKITRFKLSIVGKDGRFITSEVDIKGDRIPPDFRTIILEDAKMVLLEQVLAADKRGARVPVTAIAVRITQ